MGSFKNHFNLRNPLHSNNAQSADAETVNWTLSAGSVSVNVTATLDRHGHVIFDYATSSEEVDLTGFYLDVGNNGGHMHRANGHGWMVGYDSDGDKLDGFDFAATIGNKLGAGKDNTEGTLIVPMRRLGIDSLSDLDGAEVGFRATLYDSWHGTTLRLADIGTATFAEEGVDGENVDGYVAMADSQITELHIVFWNDDYAGDQNGDQYYVVNVKVPAELSEDPDAYLDQLVAELTAADTFIDTDTTLKGLIVTEADGDRDYYELEDWANPNGEAPDTMAWTVFHDTDHVLDENTDIEGGTENTYNLTGDIDDFLFA